MSRGARAVPRVRISIEDPRSADVRRLLERHLAYAGAHTAPEEIYALDVGALLDPAVTFVSYRVDGELLGIAALKRIDARHAEIKSMHTAEAARGRGVGRALVQAAFDRARERGARRMELDTNETNEAAIALYESFGFRNRTDAYPGRDLYFRTHLD